MCLSFKKNRVSLDSQDPKARPVTSSPRQERKNKAHQRRGGRGAHSWIGGGGLLGGGGGYAAAGGGGGCGGDGGGGGGCGGG